MENEDFRQLADLSFDLGLGLLFAFLALIFLVGPEGVFLQMGLETLH